MKLRVKILLLAFISIIAIIIAICVGGVYISPIDTIKIILSKMNIIKEHNFTDNISSIIFDIRLPRVLVTFVAGAILSISGCTMQSVLKNPLASSYTLGVSSGAALGVGIITFFGISLSFNWFLTVPLIGLLFGILTVVLSILLASKIDKTMSNNTIILVGMIFSLFINALLTLISALSNQTMQKMLYWQMGSFSGKSWEHLYLLLPILIIGLVVMLSYCSEIDNLTFGEDAAFVVGINVKKIKWILMFIASGITGVVVSMVGIIGFIDLVAPNVTRKIFGSSHKILIPMSAIIGGTLMVISDVVSRTIISPSELPIGAVTAIVGAPFFAYIYFSKKEVV